MAEEQRHLMARRGEEAEIVPLTKSGLDVDEYDTSGEAVMELTLPNGQPAIDPVDGKPVTITLVGADSEVYRKSFRATINRAMAKRTRKVSTVEETEVDAINTLARCTMAWKGLAMRGQILECNFENARMLYTTYRWIKEQVDGFVTDRANFTGTSSTDF
jgi:hypothetical protein